MPALDPAYRPTQPAVYWLQAARLGRSEVWLASGLIVNSMGARVDVRRREHAIISCFHEAGHAVMAWHHGIKILYVTMTAPDDRAHAGLTATADDDTIGLAQTEARMQVAAAGEIAQNCRLPVSEELTDDSLLRRFTRDERVVADSEFPRFNDRLIFAWWGRTRDEVIGDAALNETSGPASWLPAFRNAEQLIRGDLWSAVEAVAEELSWSTSELSHEDVATLAATVLNQSIKRMAQPEGY